MSHRNVFALSRSCGLLCLFLLILACSRLATDKSGPSSDLTLTLTLDKAAYLPGEPVIATLTLANTGGHPLNLPQLDHGSLAFTFQPQSRSEVSDLRFIEPVYSTKEQTGITQSLAPQGSAGSSLTRRFSFANLTFDRGGFVLGAVYSRPAESSLKPPKKTYAKGTAFTVQGEKVYTKRYLNGLITREEAAKLALAQTGGKLKTAEALLVTDEAGFQKWWVNLTLEGGQTRSWFVDPYYGKVWKEARPFTTADKGGDPQPAQDAKIIQQLKDQSSRSRER
jgi:hypothetical protein